MDVRQIKPPPPHQVVISTVTITADATLSRTLRKYGKPYATIQAAADASDVLAAGAIDVGQQSYPPDIWQVYRGGLFFDCSALTQDQIDHIQSAIIRMTPYGPGVATADGFDVHVVNGDGLTNPLAVADYGYLLTQTTSFGSVAIPAGLVAPYSALDIALNALGLAKIVAGIVQFGLRGSTDIAAVAPTAFDPLPFPDGTADYEDVYINLTAPATVDLIITIAT